MKLKQDGEIMLNLKFLMLNYKVNNTSKFKIKQSKLIMWFAVSKMDINSFEIMEKLG